MEKTIARETLGKPLLIFIFYYQAISFLHIFMKKNYRLST